LSAGGGETWSALSLTTGVLLALLELRVTVIFLINLLNIPEILPATFRSQFSIP
jgi:hypothetical protein